MSVADDILSAYVAVVGGIVFDPSPASAFKIVKRKTPETIGDAEKFVIVIGIDGSEDAKLLYPGTMLIRYPVTFAIGARESAKLSDTETMTAWREQVRLASLRKDLAGVSLFNVAKPRPAGKVFESDPLDKAWTWSPWGVWAEVREPRYSS